MNWLFRGILALILVYVVLCGSVAIAMMQTPERFGAFMKHMPPVVVWVALPASKMWLWARRGTLSEGERAPDFSLRTAKGRNQRVSLSSYEGARPVVLVFGSYT